MKKDTSTDTTEIQRIIRDNSSNDMPIKWTAQKVDKLYVTCYFCHLIQGPLLYCILSWFFHSSPVHNSTCLSSPVVLTLLCLTYDCGYVFVFEKYIVTLYLILTYSNSIVLWTQFYFLYLLFSPIFNISSSLQFVYLVHCLLLICDI